MENNVFYLEIYNPEDYLEDSGCTEEDVDYLEKGIENIDYIYVMFVDEQKENPTGTIGIEYRDNTYCIVGLRRDAEVDSYMEMIEELIKN